jgi:hypothetical protein
VSPRSRNVSLTARMARIKNLADDLARAQGGETPIARALADATLWKLTRSVAL